VKQTLLDVQGLADTRGIPLQKAGVKNVEMPITLLQKDGKPQVVAARATMSVALTGEAKGTHMSRFILQLSEWSRHKVLSANLHDFLAECKERLHAPAAHLDLAFKYFIEKPAPISDHSAPMPFECRLRGQVNEQGHYQLVLGVNVPIATLCPCSKAISKYGAHNQRAEIRAELLIDTQGEHPVVWIEDVISALEACSSCPVYPVLKRTDEKYVTERAYENPKFVEDVCREATLVLRQWPGVVGFSLEVEAFESIHAHNAWAAQQEHFTAAV
jgi:GTP cyclohydrolase I